MYLALQDREQSGLEDDLVDHFAKRGVVAVRLEMAPYVRELRLQVVFNDLKVVNIIVPLLEVSHHKGEMLDLLIEKIRSKLEQVNA